MIPLVNVAERKIAPRWKPWAIFWKRSGTQKKEISFTNLSVNHHQQRRQNNKNNRRFGHSWPVTLRGEDNPWQQQCAKCSRKKVSGNPNNSSCGPKPSIFEAAVHLADQVFVASSRDITCVYCKQPTNFYTKNMSAHFMILGIQSNLTDGAVKDCTFMIARPMEVEHAISKKSRCLSNIAIFHWTMIVTEWPSCQLILLIEEILHQMVGSLSLSHDLQGLFYIPGGCLGFLPSTVWISTIFSQIEIHKSREQKKAKTEASGIEVSCQAEATSAVLGWGNCAQPATWNLPKKNNQA